MKDLQLRSLSRSDVAWRRILAGWRDHRINAELSLPVRAGNHMIVSADHGAWRARIDPRQWLSNVFPELAALAGCACDEENILALFNAMPRPLTFEHRALPYRTLRAESIAPAQDGPALPLPRLDARECPLWLTDIAEECALPPETAVHPLLAVPLPVAWLIGVSRLPAALAATLSDGDVLLITDTRHQLRCQGVTLGSFRHNEEMIMTDEHYQNDSMPDAQFAGMTETDPISSSLTDVPLKVEFLLQRRFLTIGELQHLYAGKILETDPDAEKRIEIRANGRLLARGELVRLEDRLGVELTELCTDHGHDQ